MKNGMRKAADFVSIGGNIRHLITESFQSSYSGGLFCGASWGGLLICSTADRFKAYQVACNTP
jgi:hypothetical protein